MERKDVCFEIENDDFYGQFITGSSELPRPDTIERLNKGIERLNAELESQVLSKHHDLLTQANHATNLERVIGSMQVQAQGLLAAVEKVRSQITVPHVHMEGQTLVLARVQRVCHLLRESLKVIKLHASLRRLENNPSLCATVIYDVEQITQNDHLDGVEALKDDLSYVREVKSRIVANATQQLNDGLSDGNRNAIFSSFNIFKNLRCARQKIADVVDSELRTATRHVQTACYFKIKDLKKPTDVSVYGSGMNAHVIKTQFWENVDKLFGEHLYNACRKIILLQSSLNDLHSFENYRYVAKEFWTSLSDAVSSEMKKSSAPVNRCLEMDFPKLLVHYNQLCRKLNHRQFQVRRETLSVWENAFLSRSLTTLLDPVREAWLTGTVPTQEQVDRVVRVISTALSVSLGDHRLSVSLAGSVAKCIKQMSVEAEQRIRMDEDAGQTTGPPNVSQQRNADLSNAMFHFSRQINRVVSNMLSTLPAESVNTIQLSLKDVSSLTYLQPFTASVNSTVEGILVGMHSEMEKELSGDTDTVLVVSSYMRRLLSFLTHCKETHLTMYEDPLAVKQCCEVIVNHCVKIFIYNVCSVGHISDHWRRKIQLDCSQLVAILVKFETLGSLPMQFKELRGLFNFLKSTPANIVNKQIKDSPLPHSLTMMVLFMYAGPDLPPPHRCANLSHDKFVRWLCEHQNEQERIEFIAGALQRYTDHVNRTGMTKYDDVYPLLIQLLEDARKRT